MRFFLLLLLIFAPLGALAQPVAPANNPEAAMAPGQTIFANAVSCTSGGTAYLLRQSTGPTTRNNYQPIPDGSTVIIRNLDDADHATVCFHSSARATIGAQTATTSRFSVDDITGAPVADGLGNCITIPAGGSHVEWIKWASTLSSPGARSYVCDEPIAAARVRGTGFTLYSGCINDNECRNLSGMANTATCLDSGSETGTELSSAQKPIRALYMAARCGGDATLAIEISR